MINVVIFIVSIGLATSANPPSLTDIKNLRNSELDEIFESAKSSNTPPPDPVPTALSGANSAAGRFQPSSSTGPREVPIDHGHALLAPQQPQLPDRPQMTNEFSELAQQGANVFANGATAFYRGAATVGQAFGIPQGNYEMPFLSQAAQIFGR